MEKKWCLKEPQINATPAECQDRSTIKWETPLRSWTKLNFDGASKGNLRASGIRAIIRDEQGNILHGLFGGIGVATNKEAEIRALEVGLRLYVRQGISRIIIEGDSQIIITRIS
ncbi:hypothetical protein SUGI_0686870 [Cryptomeria japonica]|nr:hypothetical protein SUGI_0686870 [Cryptomeria japonica]